MTHEVGAMRAWLHGLLDFPIGGVVVDLGCGIGDDLRRLAATRPDGRYVGVDRSAEWIDRAKEDDDLEFVCADVADRLPFSDASFDAVYCVNLLECLPDKAAFVAECARVLKPGGNVVIGHFDWDTQTFDGEDRESVRRLVHAFNDWKQAWMEDIDPWAGRRLGRYLTQHGLFEGEMHAYPLLCRSFAEGSYGRQQAESFKALANRGVIDLSEYEAFFRFQEEAEERGCFLYSVTMFAFAGRRL